MRWERLFDDLEAQAAEAEHASLGPEVADRTRRELARVRLADRFRAAVGRRVTLVVAGVGQVTGTGAGRRAGLAARIRARGQRNGGADRGRGQHRGSGDPRRGRGR